MALLIRWQLVASGVGFALALASLVTALGLKRWGGLPLDSGTALHWHRSSAWGSLAVYVAISFTCLTFHFPISDPLAALDYGWFMIHPFNGFAGALLYLGKILVVRAWKRGWRVQGTIFGCALAIFWLVQVWTVLPALRAW